LTINYLTDGAPVTDRQFCIELFFSVNKRSKTPFKSYNL